MPLPRQIISRRHQVVDVSLCQPFEAIVDCAIDRKNAKFDARILSEKLVKYRICPGAGSDHVEFFSHYAALSSVCRFAVDSERSLSAISLSIVISLIPQIPSIAIFREISSFKSVIPCATPSFPATAAA